MLAMKTSTPSNGSVTTSLSNLDVDSSTFYVLPMLNTLVEFLWPEAAVLPCSGIQLSVSSCSPNFLLI